MQVTIFFHTYKNIDDFLCFLEYLRKGPPFPSPGYDELDATHILPRTDHYRITPSPGGLGDRYGKHILCIYFIMLA